MSVDLSAWVWSGTSLAKKNLNGGIHGFRLIWPWISHNIVRRGAGHWLLMSRSWSIIIIFVHVSETLKRYLHKLLYQTGFWWTFQTLSFGKWIHPIPHIYLILLIDEHCARRIASINFPVQKRIVWRLNPSLSYRDSYFNKKTQFHEKLQW